MDECKNKWMNKFTEMQEMNKEEFNKLYNNLEKRTEHGLRKVDEITKEGSVRRTEGEEVRENCVRNGGGKKKIERREDSTCRSRTRAYLKRFNHRNSGMEKEKTPESS